MGTFQLRRYILHLRFEWNKGALKFPEVSRIFGSFKHSIIDVKKAQPNAVV